MRGSEGVYTLREDVVGAYGLSKDLDKDNYGTNPMDMMFFYLEHLIHFEITCTKEAHGYVYKLVAHIGNEKSAFASSRESDLKVALRVLDCKISENYALEKQEGTLKRKYKKAKQGFYGMSRNTSTNLLNFMKYYLDHTIHVELVCRKKGDKYVYGAKAFEDNSNRYLIRSEGEELVLVIQDLDCRIAGAVYLSRFEHGLPLNKVKYA